MDKLPDPILWQLADSAFPTGGFAHSAGLEAAWQHRLLAGRQDLIGFLRRSLDQIARGALPLVAAAHERRASIDQLDATANAFLSNHVAHRASVAQGKALLTVAVRVFPSDELAKLEKMLQSGAMRGHVAPIFGAVMRSLGVETARAASLLLFMHLRGLVSAAVRLGIVGPMEAQRIQADVAGNIEPLAWRGIKIPLEDLAQTDPLVDIVQGTQDRLYSRLFIS